MWYTNYSECVYLRWVVGWGCEQENRQPCFLTQQGSLAVFTPWLMGHHWPQQDYSLHHSWMWVLLFLWLLKRSPSFIGYHTKFPGFSWARLNGKNIQNPERRVGTAPATLTNHKISVSWVSPSCIHQLWGLVFFHRAVKNHWDLCCKLIIMTGKALQWNWFV